MPTQAGTRRYLPDASDAAPGSGLDEPSSVPGSRHTVVLVLGSIPDASDVVPGSGPDEPSSAPGPCFGHDGGQSDEAALRRTPGNFPE